jgi:hypothetical protein
MLFRAVLGVEGKEFGIECGDEVTGGVGGDGFMADGDGRLNLYSIVSDPIGQG